MSAIDWRVGDLPAALGDFDDNTFHAASLDGPYGLSEDPPFELVMRWLAGEKVKHKTGFLGREWDEFPPGPAFWREMFRVLRPGALVFSFAHSRTPGLAEMAIRAGGFRILPAFAWLHAEAQALGANVGKLIDKAAGADREVIGEAAHSNRHGKWKAGSWQIDPRDPHGSTRGDEGRRYITAPATPLARLFDGHHSRLRTNHEPILCAMKPLDGTYAENAARWGCAGFDAESGRIPTVSDEDDAAYAEKHASVDGLPESMGFLGGSDRSQERTNGYSPAGRFPSSVLIEHSVDCEVGVCPPGCPADVLAEQGGISASTNRPRHNAQSAGQPLTEGSRADDVTYGHEDAAAADRFYFQARPSRGERSAGCEGLYWQRDAANPDGWRIVTEDEPHVFEKDGITPLGNPHPALKSIELTRYLAKLLRQPGEARIIVPYCGSGSEAIGAILAGWHHVTAIDGSDQWIRTAKLRESHWRRIMESGPRGSIKEMGLHDPEQMGLFG